MARLSNATLTSSAQGKQLVNLLWEEQEVDGHDSKASAVAASPVTIAVEWLARNATPANASAHPLAEAVEIRCNGTELVVQWEGKQLEPSVFGVCWLRSRGAGAVCRGVRTPLAGRAASDAPILGRDAVPTFEFAELMGSTEQPAGTGRAILRWLSALHSCGVTLVSGAGTEKDTAAKLAASVFGCAQPTLWGISPDVPNVARPRPLPVTVDDDGCDGPTALPLHVDLCSYESTPGLQMLHCRRFDADVRGGWSTFVDGVHAAELLRQEAPEAFLTLASVPVTFQTIKYERNGGGLPAHYECRRPHIAVDTSLSADAHGPTARLQGEIQGVFWSPASEGPLRVRPQDVEPYLAARAVFAGILARLHSGRGTGGGRLLTFRLEEGDIAVFDNRRMLHGRRAYYTDGETAVGGDGAVPSTATVAAAPTRTLQGCYVAVDEWRSRLASLQQQQSVGENVA